MTSGAKGSLIALRRIQRIDSLRHFRTLNYSRIEVDGENQLAIRQLMRPVPGSTRRGADEGTDLSQQDAERGKVGAGAVDLLYGAQGLAHGGHVALLP